ncbi:MAG: LON peptidase substrate-binding domain-containing protein [Deltaproteobacteria bacterium]|nr:LON peptidase substrate-binding domain-containing protein [Deltaproteobacteria bacterium]
MQDDMSQTIIIPDELPVLALRDVVVFPYMVIPLVVGRDISNAAIDAALSTDRILAVVTQREMETESPVAEDLYEIGTACTIMRMVKLTEDRVKILVQGVTKVRLTRYSMVRPYLRAKVDIIHEPESEADNIEREARVRMVVEGLEKIASMGKSIPMEVIDLVSTVTEAGRLADIAASNLNLKIEQAQDILETYDPDARLGKVRDHLAKELALLDAQARIENMAREGIHKSQREYFYANNSRRSARNSATPTTATRTSRRCAKRSQR